jgi:hypothetical protein
MMALKKILGCWVVMAMVSGCQAGWLAGSRSGIVINAGGDLAGTTGRLARVEEHVGDLTSELNVQTRGLNWTAQGVSRDWRSVAVSADGLMQMKGGAADPIYLSSDGGMTWSAAGVTNEWLSMAMSGDGWYRSASAWDEVTDAQRYFSTNSGATWTNVGQPWALAALSGNGRYQVAAEEFGVLHVSTNYGAAWVATKTDEARHWMGLAMSTNGEYQTAVATPEDEMSSGVYVSSDYGNTWILNMAGPQWMSVAMSADGRIQLVCALGGKLYGSENHGATWTAKTGSNRAWWFVAMSADGKMQYAAERNGPIYVSGDYGATWADSGSAHCPWTGLAVNADGGFGLAAVNGGSCLATRPSTSVRGDLIVNGALTLGAGGTFAICHGTQLVFVAGTVTNVLDADIAHP